MANAKGDRWTLVFDGEGNFLDVEKNGVSVLTKPSKYPISDVETIESTYAIEIVRYTTKDGHLAFRFHHPDCRSWPP